MTNSLVNSRILLGLKSQGLKVIQVMKQSEVFSHRVIFLYWLALMSPFVSALDFTVQSIQLAPDSGVNIIPLKPHILGPDTRLLVIETPTVDERTLQLRISDEEPERIVKLFAYADSRWFLQVSKALPHSMDTVDLVRTQNTNALAGYRDQSVVLLDNETGNFEHLLNSSSMFIGRNWTSSPRIKMFADLNGDLIDDFLMPGFSGWQVSISKDGDFQVPQTIGPSPRMTYSENSEYVGYRSNAPFLLDANIDGLVDLAFWTKGKFTVYIQLDSGSFNLSSISLDPNLNDVLGDYFQIDLGENAGNREGASRLLDGVDDIDGDLRADLILKRIKAEGIFGWESQYEIYKGILTQPDKLGFEPIASSVISTSGYQLRNNRLDLNGDGKQEFIITSVDIGIGTVIKALLTRSVSTNVSIYQMVNNVFETKPSISKKVSVRFDFKNGELFIPSVLNADVNGDGMEDLLLQKDMSTLLIYLGERTDKLFVTQPIKLNMQLPKNREGFVVADLNSDGIDELVLSIAKDNGERSLEVIRFNN